MRLLAHPHAAHELICRATTFEILTGAGLPDYGGAAARRATTVKAELAHCRAIRGDGHTVLALLTGYSVARDEAVAGAAGHKTRR